MDLVSNQEVQAAFIVLLVAFITFIAGVFTFAGILLKLRGDRLEARQKVNILDIETNAKQIANQIDAQTLIQIELKRTQAALDETKTDLADAHKAIQVVTEHNRALERIQAGYEGAQQQLKELMEEALKREAEKGQRIALLEKQRDEQQILITNLQKKQDELSDSLGAKDQELRNAEQRLREQDTEISDLKHQQQMDRQEAASLRQELDKANQRLNELEQLNLARGQTKNSTNEIPLPADIDRELLK